MSRHPENAQRGGGDVIPRCCHADLVHTSIDSALKLVGKTIPYITMFSKFSKRPHLYTHFSPMGHVKVWGRYEAQLELKWDLVRNFSFFSKAKNNLIGNPAAASTPPSRPQGRAKWYNHGYHKPEDKPLLVKFPAGLHRIEFQRKKDQQHASWLLFAYNALIIIITYFYSIFSQSHNEFGWHLEDKKPEMDLRIHIVKKIFALWAFCGQLVVAISCGLEMDEDPVSQALLKSGYHNAMSIACGFRGPRGPLFKRSIQNYMFIFHGYFGVAASVYLSVQILITYAVVPDLEFEKMMFFLVPLITGTYSNINFLYMEFNRPQFIRMLKMNEEASKDEFHEDELEEEMQLWADRARKLQPLMYIVVSAPVLPWGMSTILNEFIGHPWGPRNVAFMHWFPYDLSVKKYWILTQWIQTTAGFYATLSNIMFDAVFFCLAFRILALLIHLKKTFRDIFKVIHADANGNVWYTNYSGEAANREEIEDQLTVRLKSWISHHQDAMKLLSELEALYSIPLLLHFGHAGSVLATGAAVLVKGKLPLMEFYFVTVHLLGLIITLFVICRVGDYIKIETSEILEGLAGENYFMLSKYQRTLLKTLLIGAKEPFIFRVVQTVPLDTETFKSIIATTYSFFTLFQNAKE